jgi:hypothetical protein
VIVWQWRDTGSGPGAMVRVIIAEGEMQRRYRAFLDHAQACPGCETQECETGRDLWWAYKETRG